MTKITHSDMSRGQVPVPTQTSNQNFVVEDFSETQSSVDEQLAEFEGTAEKPVVIPQLPKISPDDQRKLESLIFMGRLSKEVDIAGHKFEMCTLTHRENNEIMIRLMKIGDTADIFTVRILTLAYVVKKIDCISLDTINIEGNFDSIIDKKMSIIDQMQLSLVERLYLAYESLLKEADETIYGEKIKK